MFCYTDVRRSGEFIEEVILPKFRQAKRYKRLEFELYFDGNIMFTE